MMSRRVIQLMVLSKKEEKLDSLRHKRNLLRWKKIQVTKRHFSLGFCYNNSYLGLFYYS